MHDQRRVRRAEQPDTAGAADQSGAVLDQRGLAVSQRPRRHSRRAETDEGAPGGGQRREDERQRRRDERRGERQRQQVAPAAEAVERDVEHDRQSPAVARLAQQGERQQRGVARGEAVVVEQVGLEHEDQRVELGVFAAEVDWHAGETVEPRVEAVVAAVGREDPAAVAGHQRDQTLAFARFDRARRGQASAAPGPAPSRRRGDCHGHVVGEAFPRRGHRAREARPPGLGVARGDREPFRRHDQGRADPAPRGDDPIDLAAGGVERRGQDQQRGLVEPAFGAGHRSGVAGFAQHPRQPREAVQPFAQHVAAAVVAAPGPARADRVEQREESQRSGRDQGKRGARAERLCGGHALAPRSASANSA